MNIIKELTKDQINPQTLQQISDEAEQHELGAFQLNGDKAIYDAYWLRDHYLEPHNTEDYKKLKQVTLVTLTKEELEQL